MSSKVFEIVIIVFAIGTGFFGIFYAIKLRITSNKLNHKKMEVMQSDDKDIVKIFQEMELKAYELNPSLKEITEVYGLTKEPLEQYSEYVHTNFNQSNNIITSNQIVV